MNFERIAFSDFCDDVRHEVGNKISLIGCYSQELIVEKLPAILPKLCVLARAISPIDRPFEKLVFRAFFNDELLGELGAPLHELGTGIKYPEATRRTVKAIMVFAPFDIPGPGRLRVEAETEAEILPAGSLWIRERAPEEI